jgi:phosphatidylglycerol:prolipoprotein diacylglycerol transferase
MIFPEFDPVALQIGPVAIRWYALSYVVGILLAWRYCIWLSRKPPQRVTRNQLDDLLLWTTLGIIVGGRLGQVLLWAPGYYLANPIEIVKIWEGGMAFHGGLLGVIIAMLLYARSQRLSVFAFSDLLAPSTPIGLFLGRVANFINGELVGRPTDVPWAMIFPHVDSQPRHPSQLYQAALEGVLLFAVMHWAARHEALRARPGMLTGIFLVGYAVARSIGEVFREPEVDLGSLSFLTWGQILSVPMLAIGLYFIMRKPRPIEG